MDLRVLPYIEELEFRAKLEEGKEARSKKIISDVMSDTGDILQKYKKRKKKFLFNGEDKEIFFFHRT